MSGPGRAIAALCCVAVTGAVLTNAPAAAGDPVLHHLSGTITAGGATPQSSDFDLYRLDSGTGAYSHYTDQVSQPDGPGAYQFSVPDGTYKLRAEATRPGANYAREFYENAYLLDEATPIVVANGDTIVPAIDLVPTTHVFGSITGDGDALTCPSVSWYRKTQAGTFIEVSSSIMSHDDTMFGANLAPGIYRLRGDDNCSDYRPRWYIDTVVADDAQEIVVNGSATEIDLGNLDLHDYPQITGILTNQDGTPLFRQRMAITSADNPDDVVDTASTGYDGRFTFDDGVYGGDYRIRIGSEDYEDGADQWLGSFDFADSQVVSVDIDDDDLDLGTVAMEPGATLAGAVTRAGGAAVHRAEVWLYDSTMNTLDIARTDLEGHYAFQGLTPDNYIVMARLDGLVTEWYPDAPTEDGAVPVPTANATTTTVDIELANGPTALPADTDIWGYATGPGGRPEPAVRVCAKSTPSPPPSNVCTSSVITDANGRYAFTNLDTASTGTSVTAYKLEFRLYAADDTEPGLAPVWSGQGSSYATAGAVSVGSSGSPTRADVTMALAGVIKGTVITHSGSVPQGGQISVMDDGGRFVDSVGFDENGAFEIKRLAPGSYRLRVGGEDWLPQHWYLPMWWEHTNSPARATKIVVNANQVVDDIDLVLHDELVSSSPPSIVGSPTVGVVAFPDPGDWNGVTPPEFSYEWRRDGVPIHAGDTYTPTAADLGHELSVAVQAELEYQGLSYHGAATSPAETVGSPPPAKKSSKTTVSGTFTKKNVTKHKPAKITLTIAVSSNGAGAVGSVKITEGSTTVAASLTLAKGKAKLVIKKPAKGKHTYVVTYGGNSYTMSSIGRTTVKAS